MIDANVDHDRAANTIAAERMERHAEMRRGAAGRSSTRTVGTLATLPPSPRRAETAVLSVQPQESDAGASRNGAAPETDAGSVLQIAFAAAIVVLLIVVWIFERRSIRKTTEEQDV